MMNMRDLIPWGRNQQTTPSRYREEGDPFMTLHREMNRLFDDVFRTFDVAPLGTLSGVGRMAGWPPEPNPLLDGGRKPWIK